MKPIDQMITSVIKWRYIRRRMKEVDNIPFDWIVFEYEKILYRMLSNSEEMYTKFDRWYLQECGKYIQDMEEYHKKQLLLGIARV